MAVITSEHLREAARTLPDVFLLDLRQAKFAVACAALTDLQDLEGPFAGVFVCRPEQEAPLLAYAWTMAQKGIVRGVFTDYGRALAWAEQKARVLSHVRAASQEVAR